MFADSIWISSSSNRNKPIAAHKKPPGVGFEKKLEMQVSLLLAESKS